MYDKNKMPRRLRASKDDEAETSLFQDPRLIIGLYFVGIVLIIIICLLIYKFISDRIHRTGALSSTTEATLPQQTKAYRQRERSRYYEEKVKKLGKKLQKGAEEKFRERLRSYTL